MSQPWTVTKPDTDPQQTRSSERVSVALAARLTWKDHRGATRFASVTTRNISEHGIYVECLSPLPLSMYRLVHVQLERDERAMARVPRALREGRILSAVYRINPATPGRPQGLALRLMVDPKRAIVDAADRQRATA